MSSRPLKDAWAEWSLLKEHPWDVYVTLTFPTATKSERALLLWKRFTDQAAKQVLSCRKARKEGLPWLAAIEKHKNGNCHIHAIMSGFTDIKAIQDLWLKVAGSKIIDVQAYAPDTLSYVTKTADADGEIVVARYFNYV